MNTTLDILSFLFVVALVASFVFAALVASFVFAFLAIAADEQNRKRDVVTYNICTYACLASLIVLTILAEYSIY